MTESYHSSGDIYYSKIVLNVALDYVLNKREYDENHNVWKEFEMYFEQVHELFYNSLNKNHLNLTSRGKRLFALLKLNLTTRQFPKSLGNLLSP